MSWKFVRPALLALAATVATAMSTGCAQERDPINRVQADALDKSFFVGDKLDDPTDDPEFLTQATLIDVGYGASQDGLFTSTYTQGQARIKFQITEDLLLGRLTYERIADSDGKGAGKASTDGQVVVAYEITKHFDIRRAYNPSTGEEQNVVEENTTDRPWYERQYMRVDWSQNLNVDAYDFDTLSLMGIFGGVEYTPLAYYVNDPADEDAPFFDVGRGYFDVTNKAFAAPQLIDLSSFGWGIDSFPACFLPDEFMGGSDPAGNCNPVELTIRQAFVRVVDTDYEPADWDGWRFQAFGGFYTDRYGYDRKIGMADDKWHRFLDRYNIWQRSHYYADPDKMTGEVQCYTPETYSEGEDPHADNDHDGTEDDCWIVTVNLAKANGHCGQDDDPGACYQAANAADGGSRCDTFKQRCTLPYRYREVRPVPWYFTSKSNLDYWDGTEWATHDHDVAMRHSIQVARYAECMATAKNKELCLNGDGGWFKPNPVYFGQMDDHLEAKQLAKEVDDCRHGLSHPDFGAINSSARESKCVALAEDPADCYSGASHPEFGPADTDEQMAARAAKCDKLFNGVQSVLVARRNAGATIDNGVAKLAQMPEQVALCHSPVEHDDPVMCGPAEERLPSSLTMADCQAARANHDFGRLAQCNQARTVRIGDMRFHQINVLEAPQTPSPWGIYTDAHDPLSGETYSASVNVWSHVNDIVGHMALDRIRYIKGELSTSDITDGTYVRDWVLAAQAASGGHGIAGRFDREEIKRRVAAFAKVDPASLDGLSKATNPELFDKALQLREQIRDVKAAAGAASTMAPIYAARAKQAMGTEFEAQLLNAPMQKLAGVDQLPTSDLTAQRASILRGLNPVVRKQLRQFYQQGLAARGTCVMREAPAPMALTGLADLLEEKFQDACALFKEDGSCEASWGKFGSAPDQEKVLGPRGMSVKQFQENRATAMRGYIQQRMHYAVIVHEMGHSVGMRHNFVSSSDPMSYRPQYWQLRTNDGAVTELCSNYTDDGSSCVGPRYFDPMDTHERDNLIWMWMHSSVMDYAGEWTQDMLGLAGWDFGADRMFYGEMTAVFDDPAYAAGSDRGPGITYKTDSFGGILGIQYQFKGDDIHYSALQNDYQLIRDCKPVDVTAYQPASWDESKQGKWHPVLDGLIVANAQGSYTKCRQPAVDYRPWQALHFPSGGELNQVPYYRGGPSVDDAGKLRVPYGFGTDRWADVGNASVYRHDNGADVYEIFDFLATQQEVQHIFDNYRRGRQSFSVRSAANRTLSRYNEKIRDGAKGLGLLANIYRDFAAQNGWIFDKGYWGFISWLFFPDNILASTMVFDHFVLSAARPEPGGHYRENGVLLSEEDSYANNTLTDVIIPDGATGYFGQVAPGGKVVESRLCGDVYGAPGGVGNGCGEFDADYTMNAGSYYDKINAPYLMAESVDNFISDSRSDFVDGRYRAVSLADLYPEGYRRWLGNALTDDEALKGVHLAASNTGAVLTDPDNYPAWPLGVTSWWGEQPTICFPSDGSTICGVPGTDSAQFNPRVPDRTVAVDSEIGWESQKFLIAQTLLYLPSNEKDKWISQLRVWQLGADADPAVDNRIEFHDPEGNTYIAKTFGTETLFAGSNYEKVVQKGIAARVLQYANELLFRGYETTPVDYDGDSQPDWYIAKLTPDGKPIVKWDSGMQFINENGQFVSTIPGCDGTDNTECPCSANLACKQLQEYVSIPFYLRQALDAYGLAEPEQVGIYD